MVASFLTDRERSQLAAMQDAALDQPCVVRTTVEVADNQGGTTVGVATDVATVCRIGLPTQGSQGTERIVGERIGQVIDVVITLPWSLVGSVQPQSRVYVPDITSPTAIYEVIATNAEQSMGVGLRVLAKRVS